MFNSFDEVDFLNDVEILDGKQIKVRLKDNLPNGKYFGLVTLRTDDLYLKEVKVPVLASVPGDIQLAPAYLEFGSLSRDQSQKRVLSLSNPADSPIELKPASLSVNGDPVSTDAVKIARSSDGFSVTVTNTSQKFGAFSGILMLLSGGVLRSEVKYFGFFR